MDVEAAVYVVMQRPANAASENPFFRDSLCLRLAQRRGCFDIAQCDIRHRRRGRLAVSVGRYRGPGHEGVGALFLPFYGEAFRCDVEPLYEAIVQVRELIMASAVEKGSDTGGNMVHDPATNCSVTIQLPLVFSPRVFGSIYAGSLEPRDSLVSANTWPNPIGIGNDAQVGVPF